MNRANVISYFLIKEIDNLNDIAKQLLMSKDYGNMKIISQVNCDLRNLESQLLYLQNKNKCKQN